MKPIITAMPRAAKRLSAIALGLALTLASCTPDVRDAVPADALPPIYPDYAGVTVPVNIAPLNFGLRTDCDHVAVDIDGRREVLTSGHKVRFAPERWRRLLADNAGRTMDVAVYACHAGRWTAYRHFGLTVSADSIDPWLTYRLIEPDYEVWNRLEIRQRCLEDFTEKTLAHHALMGNRCMNCHTPASQRPDLSMMYVRGSGGGAILNRDGRLSKLNINAEGLISGSVYFAFSPSGRYVVFSSNSIIPAYHAQPSRRMEVYDKASDVYVADLQENVIIRSPLLTDSTRLETFPVFSPDGRHIYCCVAQLRADGRVVPDSLQYDIVRVPFSEADGRIGTEAVTVYSAANAPIAGLHSVSHPRVSPDGRRLLFTVARYGTFPIWHTEADLQMLDLATGRVDTLAAVNSARSDTYHSWSSNSRWFVFASKRADGLYGKPYFCHVDSAGRAARPFVMPQDDPDLHDETLKSFNAPELATGPIPFTAFDVARAMELPAADFRLRD